MTAFGVAGVSVTFRRTRALVDVSFDAPPGEVSTVVGGDGAGKTTLLRVLAGTVRPSSGSVRRPPKRAVGYVPAGGGYFADLTVEENMRFVGAAYGLRGAALGRRGATLLDATGLDSARRRPAHDLSGGMKRKLAFVLALLHEPAVLILDEPTTGVDPVSRVDLWRLAARAAAGGTAVAVSTTYLDEAERATSVLVLHEGRALLSGPPDEVVAAMPGAVVERDLPANREHAWRRGTRWREWTPHPAAGEEPVAADLEDAVIVAALGLGAGA